MKNKPALTTPLDVKNGRFNVNAVPVRVVLGLQEISGGRVLAGYIT